MNEPDPTQWNIRPNPPGDRGHWAQGMGIALLCIAMVIPLAFIVGGIASLFDPYGPYLGMMVVAVIGLSQWLFVIPMGIYLRYKRKTDSALGLWITAGIAMLLNGACFGLVQFV